MPAIIPGVAPAVHDSEATDLSPSTVDFMLGLALVVFSIKGLWTGMLKTVVSLASVLIAWFLSSTMSHLFDPLIKLAIEPSAPGFNLAGRITVWIVAYMVVQLVGSMIVKTANDGGLGGADKLGGLLLGAATGVIIGCLPIMVINAVPALYNWAPTKELMRESFFLKTYAPIAAKIVPPRKR
jgi:uncharacterized membrane protein required for colicin V production